MKLSHIFGALALLFSTSLFAAGPVDINTADAKMLASSITGIGPARAQAIVDYRTKNGPFQQVSDLARVKGIGLKTIQKNQSNLKIGAADKTGK